MLQNFRIDYYNGSLVLDNITQNWSDESVIKEMEILGLVLENNAELHFGNNIYYGSEDDYRVYIPMTQFTGFQYLCEVINGR